MRAFLSLFFCLCMFPVIVHSSQNNIQELMYEVIDELAADSEAQNAVIKQYGVLSMEQQEIIKEHLVQLLGAPKFKKYLVENLSNVLDVKELEKMTPKQQEELGRQFALALIQDLVRKGIRRLSPEMLVEYYRYTLLMTEYSDDRTCRIIAFGGQRLGNTSHLIQKFNPDQLRSFYRLSRIAIFHELDDYPLVREITSEELAFAEKAFEKTLIQSLNDLPRTEQEKMARVFINHELATDRDACEGGKIILRALIKTPGVGGDWMRRASITQ